MNIIFWAGNKTVCSLNDYPTEAIIIKPIQIEESILMDNAKTNNSHII